MSQRGVRSEGGALFRDPGQDGLLHRAFLRAEGFTAEEVRNHPVVGIANSASELNPCNAGLAALAQEVKAGVREAGGLPLEFPTISISEPFTRPTSLYLRNLMSMDIEEMISTAPIDGVVLLGGCDKTLPAQIMGALSANKPAVALVAGPRPVSAYQDNQSFTVDDVWPVCEARRAGEVSDQDWQTLEACVCTGVGTCNVLGTAATMAAVAEVLGFALPASALAPAASAARRAIARATGRRAVQAIRAGLRPQSLITDQALENAVRVVVAMGGSTNAIIHLEAIAGRVGLRIGFDKLQRYSASTGYVTRVRPGGPHLLSDLEAAGGIPAVMQRIRTELHLEQTSGTGAPWQRYLEETPIPGGDAIAPPDSSERRALVMLRGNLAPRGAILKTVGHCDPRLLTHRGRAVVFDGIDDLNARIDDPDLDVDANSILVLRGMGPLGAPGMPEVGHIPIPAKLHRQGVRDMVRISDARMSGTSTGTVVLHVTPEAAAGGVLGLLRSGDEIELDAHNGRLAHCVSEAMLAARQPFVNPQAPQRGFAWLHQRHVLQADEGCDFDFLRAGGAAP